MSCYKRNFVDGGTFFFTVVSYQRQRILTSPAIRIALRKAIQKTQQDFPFKINAWVLLPDHIHCIWTLPNGDDDYSRRWSMIKRLTSQSCKYHLPPYYLNSSSRLKRNESTLWQRRFWEHTITDDSDYMNHLNYIYWNPVKHGYANTVSEWSYSTFHRDVKNGLYGADWGDNFNESENTNFGE